MASHTFLFLLSLSASFLFSCHLGCADYDVSSTLKGCNISTYHDHCVKDLIQDPWSMEASIPGLARIVSKLADGGEVNPYSPALLEMLIGDKADFMLATGCGLIHNEARENYFNANKLKYSAKNKQRMEVVGKICQDLTTKLVIMKNKLATNITKIESQTPSPTVQNQVVSTIKAPRLSQDFWLSANTPKGGKAAQPQFRPNVVVAQDGSGNYKTVTQAVQSAPTNSTQKYVIYIKAGTYKENVVVDRSKVNLVFIGDGMGKTILSSNRSASSGFPVHNSGALVVLGDGFFASKMTFENTAGPQGGQAVAMMSATNRAAFYQCSFLGYQDTLFVADKTQFFRECDIYGTADFIFGYAAVVFQDCNIFLRQPLLGQGNVISAQGKTMKTMNSGTVFHHCNIKPAPGLDPTKVKSYLGRPWKQYATTIVMQTFIDRIIDPAGWEDFPGHGGYHETVTYWEYANTGPGANTSQRLKWPGIKIIQSEADVKQYTVNSFIAGGQWLPSLGVPFNPGFY